MDYETLRKVEEVKQFVERLNKEKFSVDTETTSLRYDLLELVGISLSDGKNTAYIPVGHRHKASGELLPDQVNLEWLISYLAEELFCDKKRIIAHNFVYDFKVLYKYGINLYNHRWFDTMVADHLLNENKKHGLKELVIQHFGDDYGIDISNAQYEEIEKVSLYACKDAFYTFLLEGILTPSLEEQGLLPLIVKVEMPFLRALSMMEINGFNVDWKLVGETAINLKNKIFEFEEEMYRLIGEPYTVQMNVYGETVSVVGNINFNSRLDLIKIIQDKLGLKIDRTTDSGNLSVGKDTIDDLSDSHPFIAVLKKYKIAQKLLAGFFTPMPDYRQKDDRIRASLNDTGTRTGRLSCSKPNLQQLPKKKDDFPIDTRACFIPSKGYKLIVSDYSGQELRVLAHITNCKNMIEAFKSGKDFHSETAKAFGVDRTKAKAINFGIAYRKSAYGFAKDWGTTEEEAQAYLDKYFEQFPEVKELMNSTDEYLKKNKYVKTLFGRRRRFDTNEQGYLTGKSFREAFNFLVQGFSADMIRVAAIKILNIIKNNPKWDLRLITTIHDEIVMEVKEEYAEEASKAVEKGMVEAVKIKVPVLSETIIGDNYGMCK